MVQLLGIHLLMQGTWVLSLVREDSTCLCSYAHVPRLLSPYSGLHMPYLLSQSATTTDAHAPTAHAPQQESPCSTAREPMLHSKRAHTPQQESLYSTAREPILHSKRAHARQQEKPLQWEAWTPHPRVAVTHCSKREPSQSNKAPAQPKINK